MKKKRSNPSPSPKNTKKKKPKITIVIDDDVVIVGENRPPVLFSAAPRKGLDPRINAYLSAPLAQSARFDREKRRYTYRRNGALLATGGLIKTLEAMYYPHYRSNRSRRNKNTQLVGSSASQGKAVDQQLAHLTEGRRVTRLSSMTKSLIAYLAEQGHILQAAQVPVEMPGWFKMTQADLITLHAATGKIWLWEVKTGVPVGFFVRQGTFRAPLNNVECTKLNIWHMQLHFTRLALMAGGMHIDEARVLQVHGFRDRTQDNKVTAHVPPDWTDRIRSLVPGSGK